MKRFSKRTLTWGVLTVGVLSTAAFSDDVASVDEDSKKESAVAAESKPAEEVLKLLFTEENQNKLDTVTAGVTSLTFVPEKIETEDMMTDNVLLNPVASDEVETLTVEALNVPKVTAVYESPWSKKAIANVEKEENVHAADSEEGELVGKIRRGDEADVLERGNEWTLISSGNVCGYVKNEFLVFYDDAGNLADQLGQKVATVKVDGLNVRKEPAETADIYEQADAGKEYTCGAEENGWVSVSISSDKTGYVSSQYVATEVRLGKAITIEEEQAVIQAEKEAAEKAEREKAEKAAREKAEAEKKKTKAKSQSESVEVSASTPVQASVDDLTLLAAVIELEAGTHYEGGIAVANVVLNRVNSSRFPNSISGVVYQSGQFPGAHNGKLAKILARGPKSACYDSAQAALNGKNVVGGRLFFNSQRSINYNKVSNYVIIGGNCFY